MIKPIQQNVPFKGVNTLENSGKLAGNASPSAPLNVREGYYAALNNVSDLREKAKANENLGKNVNTIA